jgi:hypothetical protein
MDVYIILEVVASPYHLASLGQFYVYCSTNLALNCIVKIFALPGVHQQVFCPLYGGITGVVHENNTLLLNLRLQ